MDNQPIAQASIPDQPIHPSSPPLKNYNHTTNHARRVISIAAYLRENSSELVNTTSFLALLVQEGYTKLLLKTKQITRENFIL